MCDCETVRPHRPGSVCPLHVSAAIENIGQRQCAHHVDNTSGRYHHIQHSLPSHNFAMRGQEPITYSQQQQQEHQVRRAPAIAVDVQDEMVHEYCRGSYLADEHNHGNERSYAHIPPPHSNQFLIHRALAHLRNKPPLMYVDCHQNPDLDDLADLIGQILECDYHHLSSCHSYRPHDPDHDAICFLLFDMLSRFTSCNAPSSFNNRISHDRQTPSRRSSRCLELQTLLVNLEAEEIATHNDKTAYLWSRLRQSLPCNRSQDSRPCTDMRREQQHESCNHDRSSTMRPEHCIRRADNSVRRQGQPFLYAGCVHETMNRDHVRNGCRNAGISVNVSDSHVMGCGLCRGPLPPLPGSRRRVRDLSGIRGLWC